MLSEQILRLFDEKLRRLLENAVTDEKTLQELRMRVGQPLILLQNGREGYLTEEGKISETSSCGIRVTAGELQRVIEAACGYSGYAFEGEIRRGYLTIAGGHRIGIAGRAVLQSGAVHTLKYPSSLNIRIAHPVKGCAERWREYLYVNGTPCHVLIISPPGCGKTTLLRDAVRLLSDGIGGYPGVTVGVVDERGEIAGTYRGAASFDLGMRTDVLDGCPKRFGMEMLLRSMNPKVLAADEIGIGDVGSIEDALRCGCRLLATLHGENLQDFLEKPGFQRLVQERVFERYFFLKQGQTPGTVERIYNRNFETLWEEKKCI